MSVVILIFGLFISACSYQDSGALFDLGEGAPVVNSCSQATDCQVGESCDEGICVTREVQPLRVTLEIAPAHNDVNPSNLLSEQASDQNQEIVDIEPAVAAVPPFWVEGLDEGEAPRRFEVPLLVEVSGTVRYENRRVPATIYFDPIAKTNDTNATRSITVITADEEKLNSEETPSDFVTHVLQNVYYNVTIQPSENSELPPFIMSDFIAEKSTVTHIPIKYKKEDITPLNFELSLPDIESDVSLDIVAVSSDDPDTLVSSWFTWDFSLPLDDFGLPLAFNLGFLPQIGLFDLIISPVQRFIDRAETASSAISGESTTPIWPIFTIGSFGLENDDKATVDSEPAQSEEEVVEIKLPAVQQPVTFYGYVDLCEAQQSGTNSTDSNEASSTELPISFYSKKLFVDPESDQPTGITTSYNTRTNTKPDSSTSGLKFAVDLLPGIYEVVINPPLDSPCEIYAEEKEITVQTSDAQSENRFQLTAKTTVRGTLKTAKGEPVYGATIHAQALNRDGIVQSNNPAITRFNRSNQTTTDENGWYELPVDLGSYDIIAKPPVASHYGWKVITDVAIDDRSRSFDCDFVLDAPVPINGSLSYANVQKDATPLSGLEGAEVRVFAIIQDKAGGADSQRNVAIGRVTADQMGSFTALIPSSLQSGL